MSITLRKSFERGGANHGWLNTKHTFSFAMYYDRKFNGYGPLRVINEDHVTPGDGFPAHPHANFEIFSYVIGGAIRHQDSMGNSELCHPGDIQFTSAGKGIIHSEFADEDFGDLHFLQIWVKPSQTGLHPSYTTKRFPDELKQGKLCLCLSPSGKDDSIVINQDVFVFASKLSDGQSVTYEIPPGRKGYVHLIENTGPLNIESTDTKTIELSGGDGAFLSSGSFSFSGPSKQAHFIFFDINY